jgi:hypothetical protein
MSIYKTYVFQYINDHERDAGFELEHGEMVEIRALDEPRAWDGFEEWAKLKEERVELVEIVEVEHD